MSKIRFLPSMTSSSARDSFAMSECRIHDRSIAPALTVWFRALAVQPLGAAMIAGLSFRLVARG
jgi:hypothetical protein